MTTVVSAINGHQKQGGVRNCKQKYYIYIYLCVCVYICLLQQRALPRQYRLYFVFWPIRKIAKSGYWLRHACVSVRLSVRTEQLGCHWTDFELGLISEYYSKIWQEN